ncbi:MAG: hypothetical protein RL662_2178 [Bacteroidota bacterium]|jgi:hypothetical protein
MKNLLILFFLIPISIYAQRYEMASNINFSTGLLTNGHTIGLGYEKHFSFNSAIVFDINYMSRKKKVTGFEKKMELDTYFFTAKYRTYTSCKGIFPYVSLGGFGGYENFLNENDYPNTTTINYEKGLIYGVSSDVGVEYNMKSISVDLLTAPMYEFKNQTFFIPVKLSIKYFF